MDEKFYDEQFELRTLTPELWALNARRLKQAADILFEAYEQDLKDMTAGESPLQLHNLELSGPATLLYGLALENILKAILLTTSPDAITDGKLRKWPKDGHDQILLAHEAKIKLTINEENILRRLSEFVRWAGRYPIPKSADKMRISQLQVVSSDFVPLPLGPTERAEFNQIYMSWESHVLKG